MRMTRPSPHQAQGNGKAPTGVLFTPNKYFPSPFLMSKCWNEMSLAFHWPNLEHNCRSPKPLDIPDVLRFYSSIELLHAYTMTLAAGVGVQQQAVNHRGVEAVPDQNWKRLPPVHQSPWYALSPDPSASGVWTPASARYCESWLHTPPNLLPNPYVKHAPGHSWLYCTTVNLLQQRPCTEHGGSSVSAWLAVLGVGVEMKSGYDSSFATDTAWLKKSLSSIPYLCSGNSDKLSIKVLVGVKQFNRGKHFDTWPFPLQ